MGYLEYTSSGQRWQQHRLSSFGEILQYSCIIYSAIYTEQSLYQIQSFLSYQPWLQS